MTPLKIAAELDKYVVGQGAAKRAVAIALRDRMRRQKLSPELAEDIMPKNIIMIGPTGVGKTEIARRLAKLTSSPFIKGGGVEVYRGGICGARRGVDCARPGGDRHRHGARGEDGGRGGQGRAERRGPAAGPAAASSADAGSCEFAEERGAGRGDDDADRDPRDAGDAVEGAGGRRRRVRRHDRGQDWRQGRAAGEPVEPRSAYAPEACARSSSARAGWTSGWWRSMCALLQSSRVRVPLHAGAGRDGHEPEGDASGPVRAEDQEAQDEGGRGVRVPGAGGGVAADRHGPGDAAGGGAGGGLGDCLSGRDRQDCGARGRAWAGCEPRGRAARHSADCGRHDGEHEVWDGLDRPHFVYCGGRVPRVEAERPDPGAAGTGFPSAWS